MGRILQFTVQADINWWLFHVTQSTDRRGYLKQKWTSEVSPSELQTLLDQKRWAQVITHRHWSGFFSNREAATAHFVLSEKESDRGDICWWWKSNGKEKYTCVCLYLRASWFSSPREVICSKLPIIRVSVATCSRESDMSSSYTVNAWRARERN